MLFRKMSAVFLLLVTGCAAEVEMGEKPKNFYGDTVHYYADWGGYVIDLAPEKIAAEAYPGYRAVSCKLIFDGHKEKTSKFEVTLVWEIR